MTPESGRKQRLRRNRRRATVEAAPYGDFIRRALRAYGRRVADGEIEELAGLVGLRDDLELAIAEAVVGLRADPHAHSWQAIADVVGITRQGAMARWAGYPGAGGARRAGGQPANLR